MSAHAARVARDHCLAPERAGAPIYGGRYRRMFEDLSPLEADDAALQSLGGPGGPCDAAIAFEGADPDGTTAAVWPFFGQFIAHDITADRSPLGHRADPAQIRNFRTPRANLEGVYGAGPVGSPYLYDARDPAKLLLADHGGDVPRNQQGIALIGDPRNDVHLFVAQMQVAFIGLHNRLVDRLREDDTGEGELFEEARRAATWHYQWVLLREFLPSVVGEELAMELLAGGSPLQQRSEAGEPFIPFEFADAAYRYGHSQVREHYRVNAELGPVPVYPDLLGFGPVAPDRAVDWTLHVDVPGHPAAQRAKRIDGRLPGSLISLPAQITGEEPGSAYASLATRDLQRGQGVGLPSGEAVARALGAEPLSAEQVGLADHGWELETPLWIYVLKEAEALEEGNRLGPVGGRIVGEVLVWIVDADPESFRTVAPDWAPTLPSHEPGRFGLADVLVPAGG